MGQKQWLKQLYDEHYTLLYRLAAQRLRASLGHTADVEDVLQEVFLLALEKNIRKHPNPAGWLVKTTDFICRKYIKANRHAAEKQRQYALKVQDRRADQSLSVPAPQAPEAAAREVMLMLEQSLSRDDWQLFKAYALNNEPVEELASKNGMTVNALRVRIHRLRSRARHIRDEQ